MNEGRETHDDGERAALYAFGVLDADETHAFEAHLAEGCARCEDEIQSHAVVARSLAFEADPVPPPPAVRARVLAAIAADGESGYRFVRKDEGEWVEITHGVCRKDLGKDAGFLLRMAAGSQVPRHSHASVEHCYVMNGDVLIAGRELRVGDYHVAAPGSVHENIQSRTGCLLLIVARPVAAGA